MNTLDIVNQIALITAISLCLLALVRCYYKPRATMEADAPRLEHLFPVIVLLLGIGLRLWQFGLIPGGFNQDGAMARCVRCCPI